MVCQWVIRWSQLLRSGLHLRAGRMDIFVVVAPKLIGVWLYGPRCATSWVFTALWGFK